MQEKRIYDLKKKNQELEKFKFVLDYKIKELKKQIEPRENDIKAMKEQIQEVCHVMSPVVRVHHIEIKLHILTSIRTSKSMVEASKGSWQVHASTKMQVQHLARDPKLHKPNPKGLSVSLDTVLTRKQDLPIKQTTS